VLVKGGDYGPRAGSSAMKSFEANGGEVMLVDYPRPVFSTTSLVKRAREGKA